MYLGTDIKIMLALVEGNETSAKIVKCAGCARQTAMRRLRLLVKEGWLIDRRGYGNKKIYAFGTPEIETLFKRLKEHIYTKSPIKVRKRKR